MSDRTEHPLNVLIVEDELLLAQAEAASLLDRGHRVTVTNSALEALQHPRHDVVVSDVQLPVVSGIELLRILQSQSPEVRVILTSGSFADLDPIELHAQGAFCLLPKPFAFAELIEAVEAAGPAAPRLARSMQRSLVRPA